MTPVMTTTTERITVTLTQTTLDYIEAREARERAEQAEAQALANLKEAYAQAGITSNVENGKKVSLIESTRAKYDAQKLATLVGPATLRKITKTEVDTSKFRSAVEVGLVKPEVVEAVTTYTVSTYAKVYEITE
jgi:hypothetical protein